MKEYHFRLTLSLSSLNIYLQLYLFQWRNISPNSFMAHIPQFTWMSAQISYYQVKLPSISSYVYINSPFINFYLL